MDRSRPPAGVGPWELRLRAIQVETGRYELSLHDSKMGAQAGPFTLRFPSVQSVMTWLDSLVIPDTRQPYSDSEALLEIEVNGVSAQVDAAVWDPIVNALFHADHKGPYLASPWWYGDVAPYVSENPFLPRLRFEPEVEEAFIQVLVDSTTHKMAAVRKEVSTEEATAGFVWWIDGRFETREPAFLLGGRDYVTYKAQEAYSALLGPMVRGAVPFPSAAAELFLIAPHATVTRQRLTAESRAFLRDLVDSLHGRRIISPGSSALWNIEAVLDVGPEVTGAEIAKSVSDCMISAHHHSLSESNDEAPTAPAKAYEEEHRFEVLVGPDGSELFALNHVIACRPEGRIDWIRDEDLWRTNGYWTDDFPDFEDDWRWMKEVKRLKGIPQRVAEINAERGLTHEFILALDVSDAIRVHEDYGQAIVDLFDLEVDVPRDLALWLATDPSETCVSTEMRTDKDPRLFFAGSLLKRIIADATRSEVRKAAPLLGSWLYRKGEAKAGPITLELIHLLSWGVQRKPRIGPDVSPIDA